MNSYSDSNQKLFVKLLDQIRKKYSENHNVIGFYNYFHEFSENKIINSLSEKLLSEKINIIISNKSYIFNTLPFELLIPIDKHPNSYAHEIIARSIGSIIKKDHPELIFAK